MAGMLGSFRRDQGISHAGRLQWTALTRTLTEPTKEAKEVLRDAEGWKWRVTGAAHLSLADSLAAASLLAWAQEAEAEAHASAQRLASASKKSWWRFVEEQLRTGAGVLHRITKRTTITADEVVCGPYGPTLDLQAVLEEDRKSWQAIWGRFQDRASAPWREQHLDPPWASSLPKIEASNLAEVAPTSRAQDWEPTHCIQDGSRGFLRRFSRVLQTYSWLWRSWACGQRRCRSA